MRHEIWLCRVLMRPGPDNGPFHSSMLNMEAHERVMARIISGDLGLSQDGYIIEPIASFATDELAIEASKVWAGKEPDREFRVVHSIEVKS